MAPATRTRKRPSNTAEAPPSPYKTSTSNPWAPRATQQQKRGGDEATGEEDEKEKRRPKTAFVTVGTTRFDALVEAVDSPSFESALLSRGFTRLVVQAGAGGHAPRRLLGSSKKKKGASAARCSGVTANGLSVEFFDYAPSLGDRFASADLVVTHAGAGSIFETLSMSRPASSGGASGGTIKGKNNPPLSSSSSSAPIPLIAVPNGALMHNHQAELASELEGRGLLFSATPETLAHVLVGADFPRLRRYEAGGVLGVVDAIDELSGRSGSGKKARKG